MRIFRYALSAIELYRGESRLTTKENTWKFVQNPTNETIRQFHQEKLVAITQPWQMVRHQKTGKTNVQSSHNGKIFVLTSEDHQSIVYFSSSTTKLSRSIRSRWIERWNKFSSLSSRNPSATLAGLVDAKEFAKYIRILIKVLAPFELTVHGFSSQKTFKIVKKKIKEYLFSRSTIRTMRILLSF